MNVPILLLTVLLILALWLLLRCWRRDKPEEPSGLSTPAGKDAEYHAVSIKMSGQACKAAQDLTGRRFLSTAAPKLPLPGCDVLECNCRFVHHKDRRSGKDRRSPFSPAGFGGGTGNFESEQRRGSDRRKDEDEDYFR